MNEKTIGRPADAATAYEAELLAAAPPATEWIRIGQKIGLDNLLVVLFELGGCHSYIPTRRGLFEGMARRLSREQLLAARTADARQPVRALARTAGMAKSTAHRHLRRLGTARKPKP